MKKIATFLLTLLISMGAWASIPDDVHEKCKDVKDYVGCVQIFMGNTQLENAYETRLKESLRLLSGRIDNSSLASFSSSIQPFTDAFSLAQTDREIKNSKLVRDSRVISKGLAHIRYIWNMSIEYEVKMMSMKSCIFLNQELENINRSMGYLFVLYVAGDQGKVRRGCSYYGRKENEMIYTIKKIANRVANGEDIGLEPFMSAERYLSEYRKQGGSIGKWETKKTDTSLIDEKLQSMCKYAFKNQWLENPKTPKYPKKNLRKNKTGCVVVRMNFNEEGFAQDQEVVYSTPDYSFNNEALYVFNKAKLDMNSFFSLPITEACSTIVFRIEGEYFPHSCPGPEAFPYLPVENK